MASTSSSSYFQSKYTSQSAMAILAEQRGLLSEGQSDSSPRRKPLRGARGTKTYDDNFDFASSFYQPMIDYLDKKLSGLNVAGDELPRLRYADERGLEQVRSSSGSRSSLRDRSQQGVRRSYTERDLKELIQDSEERESRQGRKVGKQYGYSRDPSDPSSSTKGRLVGDGETSGVKLGVSKSTLSSPLSSQYSLTKESIRKTILSKSRTEELSQKIQTSTRKLGRTHTNLDSGSSVYEYSRIPSTRNIGLALHSDEPSSSSSSNGLKKSRSFGAFTEKSVRDTEDKIRIDTLQNIASRYKRVLDMGDDISVARDSNRFDMGRLRMAKKGVHFSPTSEAVSEGVVPINRRNVDESSEDAAYWKDMCKQMTIEIEQMSSRLIEAETKLKTEVTRIKKKLQMQITELEMSLDVANKNNIDLQKTIKKYSIQITELNAHYEDVQRQLQVTLDQYGAAQRRATALQGELDEVRISLETALRAKRSVEQSLEEYSSRVNELSTINVNLAAHRTKLEQELSILSSDYDEVSKELKMSDERYQKVQVELTRSIDILHEEQERIVKIESIKKSLEIEVKNLSVRLEEVEANALVNGKRIISKLEARLRDMELELDEEKRRHQETIKILRKKERNIKEIMISIEEQNQQIALLQEALDKVGHKANLYKRQLQEQESMSATASTRVRRFQRELEAAEERADGAESNLSLIRAKHRSFVTSNVSSSTTGGGQVYLVQTETKTTDSY